MVSVSTCIFVSTVGHNSEGQQREILKALRCNRIEVSSVDWYEDIETDDTLNREGLIALQNDIFHGKVLTVVVGKLDRLSRSIRDGLTLFCDRAERGVRVVSVTQ